MTPRELLDNEITCALNRAVNTSDIDNIEANIEAVMRDFNDISIYEINFQYVCATLARDYYMVSVAYMLQLELELYARTKAFKHGEAMI